MATSTKTYAVDGFTAVRVEGWGDVEIKQAPAGESQPYRVTATADEAILPRVRAELRGDELVLGLRLDWWEWLTWWVTWLSASDRQLHFEVVMPEVKSLAIYGSGKIAAEKLEAQDLQLKISGSGRATIDALNANTVEAGVSGSGRYDLKGSAKDFALRISGSGDVRAMDLETEECRIAISGSGRAAVNAQRTLDVRISGSGAVTYVGQPAVTQHVSGSGLIRQR